MICKNCASKTSSNFCADCGQRTSVDKINFRYFQDAISNNILQINKGLFFTVKELFTRPGYSIKEYIEGKRKLHFNPLSYVLVFSTIYFLFSKFIGNATIINDFMEGFYGADGIGLEGERETSIITMLMDNYAYTTLLLIPLYALSSYIIFRKEGYNYFEHLVLNCFITGHQAIFYSLAALIPVGNVHEIGVAIAVLCSVIFTFCVFWQLFKQKGILGVIIRTFLTYLLSLIFLGITLGLIAGISESLG